MNTIVLKWVVVVSFALLQGCASDMVREHVRNQKQYNYQPPILASPLPSNRVIPLDLEGVLHPTSPGGELTMVWKFRNLPQWLTLSSTYAGIDHRPKSTATSTQFEPRTGQSIEAVLLANPLDSLPLDQIAASSPNRIWIVGFPDSTGLWQPRGVLVWDGQSLRAIGFRIHHKETRPTSWVLAHAWYLLAVPFDVILWPLSVIADMLPSIPIGNWI